jgi:AP-1 complex subunit gamma-1
VIDIFEKLMPCSSMTVPTREYGLTALAKLVTRFEGDGVARIQALIRLYSAHMNLELQQRAVEYSRLLIKDDLK